MMSRFSQSTVFRKTWHPWRSTFSSNLHFFIFLQLDSFADNNLCVDAFFSTLEWLCRIKEYITIASINIISLLWVIQGFSFSKSNPHFASLSFPPSTSRYTSPSIPWISMPSKGPCLPIYPDPWRSGGRMQLRQPLRASPPCLQSRGGKWHWTKERLIPVSDSILSRRVNEREASFCPYAAAFSPHHTRGKKRLWCLPSP